MQYRTIFVDWDGTLSESHFWDRWKNDPAKYSRYQLIQKALFISPEGKLLIADWMRGLRSYINILRYLNEVTNIPYEELESELRYSCKNMTFSDSRSITRIQELRKIGVKVVIATDNMDIFRYITVPALDLESLFDGLLISDSQGSLKKEVDDHGNSLFFGQYLTQNDIREHESVLIDNSSDSRIVENLGIDFLLVNNSHTLISCLDDLISSKLIH